MGQIFVILVQSGVGLFYTGSVTEYAFTNVYILHILYMRFGDTAEELPFN